MKRKLFFTVKILAVIGIVLAVFLLYEQFFHPSYQPCYINSTINCNAIISGPVAKTFGLPTPLYGLTGYIIILISAFYQKKKLLLGIAAFGLLFCLWIAFREIVQLRVICPVCILCQLDMITVFILAILLYRRKSPFKKNPDVISKA